jgi:predicted transposase YdaD
VTAKPFDATLKDLVETEPESWPAFLGRPTGPTTVIEADLATVSGAADKVLQVNTDPPYLVHLEFASGHDTAVLPRKLHRANGLLEDRHDLPVCSAAVILKPEADSRRLTGVYERRLPGEEEPYLTFRYQVVRVWQLPPEPLLTSGLAVLPLAPISAVTETELLGIITRIEQRLSGRRARKVAPKVWAAAYILLGMRYSSALAKVLFRGVVSMKESTTYQAILEEGRAEGLAQGAVAEAKKLLRMFGDRVFGPPDARTATAIEGIDDLARLEELFDRAQTVDSWQEVLGQPPAGRRSRRPRQS